MNAATPSRARNLFVALLCIAAAACTSLQPTTSRPSPPPVYVPPASSPAPTTAPPNALPLPPPNVPQSVPPASQSSTAPSRPQSDASGASSALLAQARNERAAGSLAQAGNESSEDIWRRFDKHHPDLVYVEVAVILAQHQPDELLSLIHISEPTRPY